MFSIRIFKKTYIYLSTCFCFGIRPFVSLFLVSSTVIPVLLFVQSKPNFVLSISRWATKTRKRKTKRTRRIRRRTKTSERQALAKVRLPTRHLPKPKPRPSQPPKLLQSLRKTANLPQRRKASQPPKRQCHRLKWIFP